MVDVDLPWVLLENAGDFNVACLICLSYVVSMRRDSDSDSGSGSVCKNECAYVRSTR